MPLDGLLLRRNDVVWARRVDSRNVAGKSSMIAAFRSGRVTRVCMLSVLANLRVLPNWRAHDAYQDRIRKSELWAQMVKEFGEQKATEMLKRCSKIDAGA